MSLIASRKSSSHCTPSFSFFGVRVGGLISFTTKSQACFGGSCLFLTFGLGQRFSSTACAVQPDNTNNAWAVPGMFWNRRKASPEEPMIKSISGLTSHKKAQVGIRAYGKAPFNSCTQVPRGPEHQLQCRRKIHGPQDQTVSNINPIGPFM